MPSQRKIFLITGANAGIGFATASELAKTGATVVLLCRDRGRGRDARESIIEETGNDSVDLLVGDLSSQTAVRDAVREFTGRYDALHVLINNAAAYSEKRQLSVDGFELQFATNYLSYFLLTNLLLDTLKASAPARIVNLSTVNHYDVSLDLDDLQSENSYEPKIVHMRSKLGVILFTFELARRLRGTNVTANCLHPGVIATNLLGEVRGLPMERRFIPYADIAPLEEGARTPVFLATSPEVEGVTGEYFDDCKTVQASDEARDEELARRLWAISAELTGLPD